MKVINKINRTVLCSVETYLQADDMINIQKYELHRVERDSKGVGLMIAIESEQYQSTIKVYENNEKEQIPWILLNNQKKYKFVLEFFMRLKNQEPRKTN